MDLTSLKTIKSLCRKYQIHPQRRRGQNFLIDKNVLAKITKTAELKKHEVVLEVGAGLGTLTGELANRVKKVFAVEQDRKLIRALKETLASYQNVEIIEGNILEISNFQLPTSKFKIVANLPYNITSAFLRKFLEGENQPSEMILLVQKEVAERIVARPGEMSLLALSVQLYSQPEILEKISRASFWPLPEVDSAILKIAHIRKSGYLQEKEIDEKIFFKIAKAGFSSRRKQLHNNLKSVFGYREAQEIKDILTSLKIDYKARAQDLALGDWLCLVKRLEK